MKTLVANGARAMGIELPDGAAEQFAQYHDMLVEANRIMNLTRVPDDPAEAVDRNYLDSLAPLTVPGLLDGVKTLCDVGSGAGFPGIPLSIARPDIRVTLMDSLGKRVDFLNNVIERLRLNAEAVHLRAEEAARGVYRDLFDAATARAVAPLPVLLELAMPLVRQGGRFIAYKGPSLDDELSQSSAVMARLNAGKAACYAVSIPGRDWDHRLCVVSKLGATPKSFPRKPGEAARNPILR
ncbi:MAG: 16S rRNA (guanine(527)-N(7))-methyltransferase RsmG [Clostridia bacterium]|nr:16S rRNA (guanine(527)-N(7))-methyltransferase RsmG [Clostridia bacterium]